MTETTPPGHTDLMISPESIDEALDVIARARIVARRAHWQKLVSDEHDRQVAEIERLHAEELRLSQGLCAIAESAPDVSATVLRSVAYDIALNCITPDIARYQIEHRARKEVATRRALGLEVDDNGR